MEISQILEENPEVVSPKDELQAYLDESKGQFNAIVTNKKLDLPKTGYWEVALILRGEIPRFTANLDFLNLIDANNPRYTGWPVWINSRNFNDEVSKPFVNNGVWEAIIPIINQMWRDSIDFVRFDPKGKFYLLRAFQEDLRLQQKAIEPLKYFDFGLPVIRSAEALAVGIAFAKAMGCDPEKTLLSFMFKWSQLQGRELVSWANSSRHISPGRTAYQDEVISFVDVPLETPVSALSEFVNQATRPLYEIFDGFELNKSVIEELTNNLIQRK